MRRSSSKPPRPSSSHCPPVLEDDFALTREDPDADDEVRFVTLGLSSLASLLVVVYVYRGPRDHSRDLGLEGKQAPEGSL